MALEDALSPIQATNCVDISFKQAVIKTIRQMYSDMPSINAVTNIIAGTSAAIGGVGTVFIAVDKADPSAPVLNLSFEPQDE